jgi:hypothetical protein
LICPEIIPAGIANGMFIPWSATAHPFCASPFKLMLINTITANFLICGIFLQREEVASVGICRIGKIGFRDEEKIVVKER